MADVTFTLEADEARAVQGFLKVLDKQRQVERKFVEMGAQARRTGNTVERSTRKGRRSMGRFVVAIGSVQGALSSVSEAYRLHNTAVEDSVRLVRELEEGYKRLVQVSTRPGEFQRMSTLTKEIAMTGVDPKMAQEMIFQAKSMGLMSDIGLFTRASRFMDPLSAIESTAKLKGAFGDEKVGSSRRALNMVIRAAQNADVTVDAIAKASVIGAQPTARLGGTPQELLAFLSVLSPALKSPETASFRIARFASILATPTTVETMTPEAREAQARLAQIDEERHKIDLRGDAIARDRDMQRMAIQEKELQRGGRRDRAARRALDRQDLVWQKEERTLDDRAAALEEEARELRKRAKPTKTTYDFKGLGLLGALEKLRTLPAEHREAIIGTTIQGAEAYSAMLTNMDAIRSAVAQVEGAATPVPGTEREYRRGRGGDFARFDPFGQRYAIALQDPTMRALVEKNIAENAKNLEFTEKHARRRLSAEATLDRILAESRRKGDSRFHTWWREKKARLYMTFGEGDPSGVRWISGDDDMDLIGPRGGQEMEKLDRAASKILEASERMERAARQQESAPNPNAHVGD